MTIRIRWMIRGDLSEVSEIDAASFEFPWSLQDFVTALRQRNVVGMVSEDAAGVVGYMVYELHANRIELVNFAVGQKFRRQGIGQAMIERLKEKLQHSRRERIVTCVRERNLAAQQFFRACGFRCVELVRNCYEQTHEDGLRFVFPGDREKRERLVRNRITENYKETNYGTHSGY